MNLFQKVKHFEYTNCRILDSNHDEFINCDHGDIELKYGNHKHNFVTTLAPGIFRKQFNDLNMDKDVAFKFGSMTTGGIPCLAVERHYFSCPN